MPVRGGGWRSGGLLTFRNGIGKCAGKSVAGVEQIESVATIVKRFAEAAR